VPAPCRDPALSRVAREGDPPVRRVAQEALDRRSQPLA
jgi:hypothetical protein